VVAPAFVRARLIQSFVRPQAVSKEEKNVVMLYTEQGP